MAAHGTQVVEQRQQHQCHVATAAEHALQVRRQLDHRAHERIETFGEVALLGEVVDEILQCLPHFFGKQGGAVDFGDAQCTVHGVQVLAAAAQQCNVVLLIAEKFERCPCLVELGIELARDDMQCLRGEFSHVSADSLNAARRT